jgi:hypothetical protein
MEVVMGGDNGIRLNKEKRVDIAIALYTQAMEDIRDRRHIEWQTFAVVNVIYLGLLKVLYDYKDKIGGWYVLGIFLIVTLFTYIWFIRIYGNSRRYDFPMQMRNRIQKNLSCDPNIRDLIPPLSVDTYGGFRRYKGDWPLWSYRGICVVLWLYWAVFIFGLLSKAERSLLSASLRIQNSLIDFAISYNLHKHCRITSFRLIAARSAFVLPVAIGFILEWRFKRRAGFLFSIPSKCCYWSCLNAGNIPERIKQELEQSGHKLSESCRPEKKGWRRHYYLIIDKGNEKLYSVRKRKSQPRRILKLFDKPEYELRVCLRKF